MLIVEPIPPEGTSARPVLYTCTPATPSDARSAKSNERVVPLCVGIWRPLTVTRLYSGPKPRTVTWLPSPRCRSMDTPVMRCSDSARFWSGNLPISSAEIASTTPVAPRLISMDRIRLPRMPIVTISSMASSPPAASSCATDCAGMAEPNAIATATASGFLLNEESCMPEIPPDLEYCF